MGTLRVWMNGVEVALWDDARNRASRLSYLSQWIGSTQSRPLSLSLPLLPDGESHQGQVVNDYFDNLLPITSPSATGSATGSPRAAAIRSICLKPLAGIVWARCSCCHIRAHRMPSSG